MTEISNIFKEKKFSAWAPDIQFCERLHKFYKFSLENHIEETSILWGNLIPSKQKNIHDALLIGGNQLHDTLSDISKTNLFYGVDDINSIILEQKESLNSNDTNPIFSIFIQLAENIGALDYWNMQGGSKYPDKSKPRIPDIEELILYLDQKLPSNLFFPNPFMGEHGPSTSRGVISYRAIQAIYQAYRIYQILQLLPDNRVLEIGAGTGRTAFYTSLFGIKNYTIVDLPMSLIGQACFLAATIGPEKLRLFGEDKGEISLLPPSNLLSSRNRYNLVVNVDSITEMSIAYAEKYIDYVKLYADAFISINHEANDFTVKKLLPNMLRFPYSLRQGYVEELWFNSVALKKSHFECESRKDKNVDDLMFYVERTASVIRYRQAFFKVTGRPSDNIKPPSARSWPRDDKNLTYKQKLIGLIPTIDGIGAEIGPLNIPIISKINSRVLYVDHLTTEMLNKKYPSYPGLVEIDRPIINNSLVDTLSGDAPLDYIVGSQVFENIPNPIGWLKDIATILGPKGLVSLSLPDRRMTFDLLREETCASDMIAAYLNNDKIPSAACVYDHHSMASYVNMEWASELSINSDDIIKGCGAIRPHIVTRNTMQLVQYAKDGNYLDIHAWVFTPVSFLLAMSQLAADGLLQFRLHQFYPTDISAHDRGNSSFTAILEKAINDDTNTLSDSYLQPLGD